jgi:hypothetical protein
MRTAVSSALAVAATLAAALFANGCSSDPGCKPGNENIDGTCRLLCTKQSDCPSDYSCTASGAKTFCTANEAGVSTKAGEFGTACRAALKIVKGHPDCAANFDCYGQSPGDAEAYCTKYNCTADAQCPGGFYCATVNEAPNAATFQRSWGPTAKVCAKRSTYCSPCASDVDCTTRGYSGAALRCVADASGAKFCSTACETDANCNRDSACKESGGVKSCQPIAGSCKGDGKLCGRCSSDAQCDTGAYCYEQEYTKERFCTAVPTGGVCGTGACGTVPAGAPYEIGCARKSNGLTPTDQCVGLRDFGTDNNGDPVPYLGCWAANATEK